jgi:hypothetical protein
MIGSAALTILGSFLEVGRNRVEEANRQKSDLLGQLGALDAEADVAELS